MKLLGGAAVAAALLVLSGCGGASTDGAAGAAKQSQAAREKAQEKAEEKAAEERQQAAADRKAKATALYRECQAVAGPLDEKLTALNSRLTVGLPFAKYSDLVGEAQVSYDALIREAKKRGGISDQCINRVGTPLENALNAYVSAYNTWNDCINETYCTFEKGSTSLKKAQASWTKGGTAVSRADNALNALQP